MATEPSGSALELATAVNTRLCSSFRPVRERHASSSSLRDILPHWRELLFASRRIHMTYDGILEAVYFQTVRRETDRLDERSYLFGTPWFVRIYIIHHGLPIPILATSSGVIIYLHHLHLNRTTQLPCSESKGPQAGTRWPP